MGRNGPKNLPGSPKSVPKAKVTAPRPKAPRRTKLNLRGGGKGR